VYIRPSGSIAFLAPGCVPAMNQAVVLALVHGPGLPPVQASMVALTRPDFGRVKFVTGQDF
jgi:hypothetical protein